MTSIPFSKSLRAVVSIVALTLFWGCFAKQSNKDEANLESTKTIHCDCEDYAYNISLELGLAECFPGVSEFKKNWHNFLVKDSLPYREVKENILSGDVMKIDSCLNRPSVRRNLFSLYKGNSISLLDQSELLSYLDSEVSNMLDYLKFMSPNGEYVANSNYGPSVLVVEFEKNGGVWRVQNVSYSSEVLYAKTILTELLTRFNSGKIVLPEGISQLRLPIRYYTMSQLEPWSVFETRDYLSRDRNE